MSKASAPTAHSRRFLIVMRHAKSDWSDAARSDHQRPLNDRGSRDAPRMARWLEEVGMVPDLVLSSTSLRTRETIERMSSEWKQPPIVTFTESLYLADPETILRAVHSDGCDAQRLMVLGHNPGITQVVSLLAGQSVDMPTAAIAVFETETPTWDKLPMSGAAKLVHYMRPKAL